MNPLSRKLNAIYPLTATEMGVLQNAFTRTVNLTAGRDIVHEGDTPTSCNLLLEGWVCRYKITPGGRRQIIAFQFPGDIFDAQSFVLDEMDHSIGTLTPCKVAPIPHTTMQEITEEYPRIARAIWKDTLVDAAVFRAFVRSSHPTSEAVWKLSERGFRLRR